MKVSEVFVICHIININILNLISCTCWKFYLFIRGHLGKKVRPRSLSRWDFLLFRPLSFITFFLFFLILLLPSCLNSSFCLLDLIPPCCIHAQVLCTALLHELDIFCSYAGCCLLFTRGEIVLSLAEVSYLRKLDYNDSNYNFVIMRYLVANCKRFVIAIAGKYYSFFFIVFYHELSVRLNMNMSYVFSSDRNFHVAKEMFIFYWIIICSLIVEFVPLLYAHKC